MFDKHLGTKSNCLLGSKFKPKWWLRVFIDIKCSKIREKPLVKDIGL